MTQSFHQEFIKWTSFKINSHISSAQTSDIVHMHLLNVISLEMTYISQRVHIKPSSQQNESIKKMVHMNL